jgi:hypothetical protein
MSDAKSGAVLDEFRLALRSPGHETESANVRQPTLLQTDTSFSPK